MTYLQTALTRIVAMQLEVSTDAGLDANAVDYWPYWQERFPYWVNRVARIQRSEFAEDTPQWTYNIEMRLIMAHWTAEYRGETHASIIDLIPQVLDFFDQNPGLTSTAYPDRLNNLFYDALMLDNQGVVIFPNSGVGAKQIGVAFLLELPFIRSI